MQESRESSHSSWSPHQAPWTGADSTRSFRQRDAPRMSDDEEEFEDGSMSGGEEYAELVCLSTLYTRLLADIQGHRPGGPRYDGCVGGPDGGGRYGRADTGRSDF